MRDLKRAVVRLLWLLLLRLLLLVMVVMMMMEVVAMLLINGNRSVGIVVVLLVLLFLVVLFHLAEMNLTKLLIKVWPRICIARRDTATRERHIHELVCLSVLQIVVE